MDWKKQLDEAKALGEKARLAAREQARAAVERNWPTVQRAFRERVGRPTATVINNDQLMARVLPLIYEALPMVVRLAIKEPEFVAFCLDNRHRLPLPIDDVDGSERKDV